MRSVWRAGSSDLRRGGQHAVPPRNTERKRVGAECRFGDRVRRSSDGQSAKRWVGSSGGIADGVFAIAGRPQGRQRRQYRSGIDLRRCGCFGDLPDRRDEPICRPDGSCTGRRHRRCGRVDRRACSAKIGRCGLRFGLSRGVGTWRSAGAPYGLCRGLRRPDAIEIGSLRILPLDMRHESS